MMDESIPHAKKILVINNNPEVLAILEKKLIDTYPNSKIENATSYKEAMGKLGSWTYDLVILDITQVWSFHVLNYTLRRSFPVVIFKSLLDIPELLNVPKK